MSYFCALCMNFHVFHHLKERGRGEEEAGGEEKSVYHMYRSLTPAVCEVNGRGAVHHLL